MASCAHVDIRPDDSNDIRWDLKGKVGLTIDDDGGSASFTWSRVNDSQWIELSGPLGVGRVQIQQVANEAKLVDSKGNVFFANTIDELLLAYVQWPIPFNEIAGWIETWRIERFADEENQEKTAQTKVFQKASEKSSIHNHWLVDVKDVFDENGKQYPRKVFFTAKKNFREYVSDALTIAMIEGRIEPVKFTLPPNQITVKLIFSSIE